MNPVLYWNSVLLEVSRRDFTRGFNNAQQPGPIRTSRAMAIVHLAIHDAVAFRDKPAAAYLEKKAFAHNIVPPLAGMLEDIIAGAAVTTLKALYPKFSGYIDDALNPFDAASFNEGVLVGEAVLADRANDGSNDTINGPQSPDPAYGEHRADPFAPNQMQLGPKWGMVKRFLGVGHKPLAPFPGSGTTDFLADPAYKLDFKEVRDHGAVTRGKRSADQQRIGVYWGYDGANNLGVPPRLYNQVARKFIQDLEKKQPNSISIGKMAELFAVINVAMADAGIDAWHYKYLHKLWRPVVGVREEGPPEFDCFWAPLGAPQTNGPRATLTPNFPAYPSGHATFGAALMQVLRLGLNTAPGPITLQNVLDFDKTAGGTEIANEAFNFVSDELDGVASDPDGSVRARVDKRFRSFAEAIWENSVSRIYLGVHWRFDGIPRDTTTPNVGGVPLGLAIGSEAHDFFNNGPSLGTP